MKPTNDTIAPHPRHMSQMELYPWRKSSCQTWHSNWTTEQSPNQIDRGEKERYEGSKES